ncbi:hypothetical protein [Microbacterium sp.]|uniref:hypothetical protein n=1 Tax=Microbacterium sp. TaxID=51671 RepID=UPI0039E3A911
MPTYHDPILDGREASEALGGLAEATRNLFDPGETHVVTTELLSAVATLRQVVDQLAGTHILFRVFAHDNERNHMAGATAALAAADELHQAGTLLDAVHERLTAAVSHSAGIVWHEVPARLESPPTPTPLSPTPSAQSDEAAAEWRWINVVFLQGDVADKVLDIIDRDGADAAIAFLSDFDYGSETTEAALENGYVYARPPAGTLDRTVTQGDYTLVHNPFAGYVSLYRRFGTTPDDAPEPRGVHPLVNAVIDHHAKQQDPSAAARSDRGVRGQAAGADWFSARPGTSSVPGRGLSL